MKTYMELLAHPEAAVTFGPQGFQLTDEAWKAIAGQAYLNSVCAVKEAKQSAVFEQTYEVQENFLLNQLKTRIKQYAKTSPAHR